MVGKRAKTEILSQLSKLGFYVSRKKIANWNFTQVSDMLSSSDGTYLFEESVKNTDLIESNYVMLHKDCSEKKLTNVFLHLISGPKL